MIYYKITVHIVALGRANVCLAFEMTRYISDWLGFVVNPVDQLNLSLVVGPVCEGNPMGKKLLQVFVECLSGLELWALHIT